jgi:hypothetical protein
MRAIPTVDRTLLLRPSRRTRAVVALLGLAALLAAAAAAHAARDLQVRHTGFLSPGESTILVVDLSLSIPPVVYRRMQRVVEAVAREDGTVGLVVFSDSAYELLPPGTPARELRPYLRFFRTAAKPPEVFQDDRPYYLPDPWSENFRSGTKISEGIDLARAIVERDRVRASVLLLSDLHSGERDHTPLVTALQRLGGADVELRVVPLFPLPHNRQLFLDLAGPNAFSDWERFVARPRGATLDAVQTAASSPVSLALTGGALLVLLAANELWCRRIDVTGARA